MLKKILLSLCLILSLNNLKSEVNNLTQTNTTNFIDQNSQAEDILSQEVLNLDTINQIELINQQDDLTFKDKLDLLLSLVEIKLDRIKKHIKKHKKEYIYASAITVVSLGTLIFYLNKNNK